jgi:hypothetical protein
MKKQNQFFFEHGTLCLCHDYVLSQYNQDEYLLKSRDFVMAEKLHNFLKV